MINLIQPISFYDRLQEQDYQHENSYGPTKFLADQRLIPFQIKLAYAVTAVTSFRIVGFKYIFDILLQDGNQNLLKIYDMLDYKQLLFFGGETLKFHRRTNYPNEPPAYSTETLAMCPDYYHYEVTLDTGKTYYSEKFYIAGDGLCDRLPITLEINAWNDSNKYGHIFPDGFKYKAYFNAFITNQIAEATDEYAKDGYERNILQRRVLQFPYNFEPDPVPFSVSNGLSVLTAFNNFVVKENGNEYLAELVTLETEQVEGSSSNRITFKFYMEGSDIVKTFC